MIVQIHVCGLSLLLVLTQAPGVNNFLWVLLLSVMLSLIYKSQHVNKFDFDLETVNINEQPLCGFTCILIHFNLICLFNVCSNLPSHLR